MTDKSQAMNSTSVDALQIAKNAQDNLMLIAPGVAKMRKKLFDEYVAVGFTPDQALQLCVK